MTDLKLDAGLDGCFDLVFDGTDIVMTDDLETSVMISIEGIGRASDDDDLPNLDGLKRGWWGDAVGENQNIQMGSKLWLLSREKLTRNVLVKVKRLFFEALEWMNIDGVTESIQVFADIYSKEVVAVQIDLYRPKNKEPETFRYFYNWEAQSLAREIDEGV